MNEVATTSEFLAPIALGSMWIVLYLLGGRMKRTASAETLMRKIKFDVRRHDNGDITVHCRECAWTTRGEAAYGEGMAFANRRKREHRRDHIMKEGMVA